MALLNFAKYNDIEKALIDHYAQMMSVIMGMNGHEARKSAEDMLNQAIKESKKEGTYNFPQNLGDIILGNAESNSSIVKKVAESLRRELSKKKAEGVKDEDVRWWWNLNDIERRMMLGQDEIARSALFLHELQGGNGPKNAAEKVRKFHPMYGDPDDTTHTTGDDRPLPYELKDRVNVYIEKMAKGDPEKYKAEIEQSTTFNALVRKEIRAGKL